MPLRTMSGGSHDYLCPSGDPTPCPLPTSFTQVHSPDSEESVPSGFGCLVYKRNELVLHTLRLQVLALAWNSGTISKITNCLSDIGAAENLVLGTYCLGKRYQDFKSLAFYTNRSTTSVNILMGYKEGGRRDRERVGRVIR